MANFNVLDAQTVVVELPVPCHAIIFTEMRFHDWKKFFRQKKVEAATPTEKVQYNECLKTLLYSELCNAELIKIANSKLDNDLTIKFTFEFSDSDCLKVFQENLRIVSVVAQTI